MASSKRGAPLGRSTNAVSQSNGDGPPPKRRKSNEPSRKSVTEAEPTFSRPREEEPMFPRGGGSVLSPLEQKHIQIQAKADALFDTASTSKQVQAEGSGKRKRSGPKDGVRGSRPTTDEDAVKIESLNFKVR